MLTHILVAIDFSATWPLVQARLQQLPALGCKRLTLTHVIATGYTQAPELSHREHYENRLREVADELAEATGLAVDWMLRVGPVARELIAAAKEKGAGSILAGAQGHGRVREFFLGSTALDLARLADRPLLLAPVASEPPPAGSGPCRPLLATDASEAAAGAEAAFVRLLPHCGKGVVVSVGDWDDHPADDAGRAVIEGHLDALEARTGEKRFERVLVGQGRPSEAIVRVATEQAADLIIIGRRGHNPMTELLLGSTAEAVCRNSGRLVLLVPRESPA